MYRLATKRVEENASVSFFHDQPTTRVLLYSDYLLMTCGGVQSSSLTA